MPKIVPKSIQTCFERVLGQIFWKMFLPSVPRRVFENFQKFSKKILSKFQKCPKVFPKVSKRVLNMFWGKFFEKFLPSFPWNVEFSKIFEKKYFQNSTNAQKCSQKYPNVFYGDFFRKKFMPSVPWRVESSKIFKEIKKVSNFLKCPKSFPKVSKRVLNVFWDKLFKKILPSFPWKVESLKIFKKISFQNSKNAQNRSQKYPNVF